MDIVLETASEMHEPQKTERLGVSRLEHYFSSHGWLFREQFLHDFGIDAQVEIVSEGKPTGALIGIQIKSGTSYFSEETITGFVYRTDDKHISYWNRYSLPVIIVLYSPERDECYWEWVSDDRINSTGNGWKIEIPKGHLLSPESLTAFCKLTQPPPYLQKLTKLRLDRPWMRLLAEGESIYIEFESWVNKSLPRFQIRIGCESCDDMAEESWPTTYGPGLSIEAAISHLIPWADYEMDFSAHREFMNSVWFDECYSGHDSETGTNYYTMAFEDWYRLPEKLSPVSADGEVDGYRLLLSLNEIGKAFLFLDEFLEKDDLIGKTVFTL